MIFTMTRPSLNPNLKEFWRTKADIKILKGGRASSKTWDAAGFSVYLSSNYKTKYLCIRQFQNRIRDSVHAVLAGQIDRFYMNDKFQILENTIRCPSTGSEFFFYGMSRNTAEIKGFEGADIIWIEEGEGLTKEQWEIIEPTARKEGAEIWILYNPRLVNDFVESFKHDPENGIIVKHINYIDNPFLSDTMARKIERMKSADYEQYQHIYLGVPKTDDDAAVIKRSWIEAAIDAHVKLEIEVTGEKRIGFDVADSGGDLNAQIYRHGILASWGEHWKAGEDELLKSCRRVYSKAREFEAKINYDSIGVGALAGSVFADLNEENNERITYAKFIAGGGLINPTKYYIDDGGDGRIKNEDFFSNLKAQAWWSVADRFRNTFNAVTKGMEFEPDELISISSDMPNLDNLITELSTPHKHYDKVGKVKVESKDDLAKRDIASPNDADAFIMAFAPEKRKGFFDV